MTNSTLNNMDLEKKGAPQLLSLTCGIELKIHRLKKSMNLTLGVFSIGSDHRECIVCC